MRRNPAAEAAAASRRLVVVPAHPDSWVFQIRKTGLEGELRVRGVATILGASVLAQAQREVAAETVTPATLTGEQQAAIDADNAAEESLQAQAAGHDDDIVERVERAYREHMVPMCAAAIESMGLLRPELVGKSEGLQAAGVAPAAICQNLDLDVKGGAFLDPIVIVPGPVADISRREFALSLLDEAQITVLARAIMEHTVSALVREVTPFREAAATTPDQRPVGTSLRPETMRAASARSGSSVTGGGGARSRGTARGKGGRDGAG